MLNPVQTTSRLRLPPGRLYGQNLRARSVGSLTLTEIFYPLDSRVLKHSHELSQLCFVRGGAFSEVFGRKTREVKAFTLIVTVYRIGALSVATSTGITGDFHNHILQMRAKPPNG